MIERQGIANWVMNAPTIEREFREAIHTVLLAIALRDELRDEMIIKGGMLIAIKYNSRRFTRDIDFSTPRKLAELDPARIRDVLTETLREAVNALDYGLDCAIQTFKIQPTNPAKASFPSIKMTIGYAYQGTPKHRRLLVGNSPTTLSIDYSYNEDVPFVENLRIGDDKTIVAYSLTDLMAEKYRALLQQSERNRQRRQDVFDLYFLISKNQDIDGHQKLDLMNSLLAKSRSRGIEPQKNSMTSKDVYENAKAGYHTLASEVDGDLPNFDKIFQVVQEFYESLDW